MTRQAFTLAEVAEIYRVSTRTVLTWIHGKDIAAINIGTQQRPNYRFTTAALDQFEKRRAA